MSQILDAMRRPDDLYFDDASQIRMDIGLKGRVALIGDACLCPSLLAGQGAALAVGAAYILAGELKACGGDHMAAFHQYQERLSQFIASNSRRRRSLARGLLRPHNRACSSATSSPAWHRGRWWHVGWEVGCWPTISTCRSIAETASAARP